MAPFSPVPVPVQLPPIQQLWLRPLLLLGTLFVFFYGLGVDFYLADFIYQLQGHRWALQHFWLTEDWLHRGVRTINQWLVVLLLLSYVLRLWWQRDLRALQAASDAGGPNQPKPSQAKRSR